MARYSSPMTHPGLSTRWMYHLTPSGLCDSRSRCWHFSLTFWFALTAWRHGLYSTLASQLKGTKFAPKSCRNMTFIRKEQPVLTNNRKPQSCMDQFERYPENEPVKDGWIESFIIRLSALVNGADRKP